ncbi:MAG: heparan-alpha-glucosaminide N-acetyltransferase [Peptococcaceae bacterium]|nr:heparan-alpha-glucosaminide N-acetyltransferase [Peptococcaceae bacterium]
MPRNGRIWELDMLRGIALVFMIYFHVIYDLNEFFGYPVTYESGFNYFAGKAAGTLFIFAAGISATLAGNNLARGFKLLGIAAAITAATHLYNTDYGIKFGILHFLGVSILAAPPVNRANPFLLLAAGVAVTAASPLLRAVTVSHNCFFFLGLTTPAFHSADFYPLIPWYGIFLCGLAAGKLLYSDRKSLISTSLPETILNRAGRKTLLIYLAHQPVIMLLLNLWLRW